MTTDPDSRVILANAIDRLADSLDHLAVASQALTITPGGPQSAVLPQPSGAPIGPPAGPPGGNDRPAKTRQEKMAAKVYALCKTQNWDMADAMARATGRGDLGADSRQLSEADLAAVLDGFKQWNVG